MTSFADFYASPVGHFFRRLVLSHLGSVKPQHSVLGVGPIVPIIDEIVCKERTVLVPKLFWDPIERSYPITSFNEKSALPLKKEGFDHAIIVHTLEYADYPASFLREIWRGLRPGGTLVISTPNQMHPFDNALTLPESTIYTTRECDHFLTESFFNVSSRRTGLLLPPRWIGRMPKMCGILEQCLSALPMPYTGRITFTVAQKDVNLSTSETAPLAWQRA